MLKQLAISCAALVAAPLHADTITGRLVRTDGTGIANGDVDAVDLSTNDDVDLNGDATDANGFFSVTIPAGLYDLTFQGPPGGRFVDVLRPNVSVSGTLALGDIVLEDGFFLGGRVVDQNGFPVANCDLDVFHGVSGVELPVSGARTGIFGTFNILVPSSTLVHFDPRNVPGPTLAPRRIPFTLLADVNVGDLVLPPGFAVSGTVRRPGGAAVSGVQLDFHDPQGNEVLTYDDSTDALGNFSTVVAANTYDVRLCPPAAESLAAREVAGLVITGPASLGNLTLTAGFLLFGTITDGSGLPVQGIDVDVLNATTGEGIALCGDGTNAAGAYSVRVPVGLYDVFFTGPNALALRTDVIVAGATQVDAAVSPCPRARATMRNGTGVNPVLLRNLSPPRIGRSWKVELDCTGHAPNLGIIAVLKGTHPGVPTALGEYLLSGPQLLAFGAAHQGNVISFSTPIPPQLHFCGRVGSAQGLVLGAPGPQFTNALDLLVGH